ncbi:hypothetical protein VITFI_CDS0590 [Vitreoscilla filiformis]|uniref:Uncharacterized protein n=1 Tax=Vitreoscilla filiformis TaxID=63 RepID=A0A221KBM3_VITFI|nr:hypothetical protein VITFI_CDS0590 [Vitreoscilla filiformis]
MHLTPKEAKHFCHSPSNTHAYRLLLVKEHLARHKFLCFASDQLIAEA